MITEYTYKKQADGRDSWIVTESDENRMLINRYMVYEDPNKPKPTALEAILNASPEEIEQIKQLLNIK